MKTYTGYRIRTATESELGTQVLVHADGREPRPLDPRLDLRRHSETGLEWGYAGSGPAQLALGLAADVLGDDERAQDIYQKLKFKLVGRLPKDGWSLTEDQLLRTIAELEQDRSRDR